jgi:hypothetical protein
MSVLVLCMGTMACTDERSTVVTEFHASMPAHDHQEPDVCSPFCVCSCCPGVGMYLPSAIGFVHPLPVAIIYQEQQFNAFFKISKPIWQPPRT